MKKNNILFLILSLFCCPAFAGDLGSVAIGAGLTITLAAFGGALGQGLVGFAAMQGIARNPEASKSMFVPMIIGLVLIESLILYALLVAYKLAGIAEKLAVPS